MPDKIDFKKFFKQYKMDKARYGLLKIEEQQINKEILCSKEPSVKAQVITDMPTQHNPDSPVERFAVQSEQRQIELNAKLIIVQNELFELKCKVDKVEIYLDVLGSEERFIIEQKYIESLKWPNVEDVFQCKYKKRLNTNRLLIIHNMAIKQIEQLMQPK